MTRARFYAQTALSESALCPNEHEMIPACIYETNNAYMHCMYETWNAETTGHELFTPFSDPQERCTQTGAESRSGDVHPHMQCGIALYLHLDVAMDH